MKELMEPEHRERLEAQRDFLLRSLDDLDGERAAGDVDTETHARLHDDYTARAAAVIRALRDGVDARPPAPLSSWWRRLVVGVAVAAFAAVSGVALAAALGARLPGRTSSGNTEIDGVEAGADRRAALERAVAERPDDLATRLALARFLEGDDDLPGALLQYDEVVRRDPDNADALAQGGRLLYITASRVPGTSDAVELVAAARERLDLAVAADPAYADARFFRAVLLAQERLDEEQAIADAQRYLILAPGGQFADQAHTLLADLGADVPSGTTAPPNP